VSKENDDIIHDVLRTTGPGANLISDAEKAADLLLNEGNTPQPPPVLRVPPPVVPAPTRAAAEVLKAPGVEKVAAETVGKPLTNEQLADMITKLPVDQMEEFTRRVAAETRRLNAEDAAKPVAPKYVTDFSNISEKDIWDLRVPIEAINHEIPEFLTVKLTDKNYEPRWIQTNSRRMGQVHAEGWKYVTQEDLAEDLKIQTADDASGHFVYADVVLMKIPKAKLYARYRANFLKSLAVTKSQAAIHEVMKNVIQQDLKNSEYGNDYLKYNKSGAMNTYSPLVGA
jgi:hypothetical protein